MKADYTKIAATYDVARPISELNLALWLRLISEKIGPLEKVEILDLGCGTGRFSIPIATRLGYSVRGADSSKEMLSRAREKDVSKKVKWDVQDATTLSYPDGSFDVVFMTHLLHHVDEPLKVVRECFRVLRSSGIFFNRYGAIEDILDDPEHRFFPETVELDEARTPTVERVEEWFTVVGFEEIASETIVQRTFHSAEERLEKVRLKSTSVLTLISESAFELGLKNLREYISENPDDPWLLQDRLTLTTGARPGV